MKSNIEVLRYWITSATAIVFLLFASNLSAQLTVRAAAGANPAAIQATVDQFRVDLGGANNGINEHIGADGRREVNWDGTPNGFAAPNTLNANFFNQNSQRGLQLFTVGGGTGFMVSDAPSGGNGVGALFINLNANYASQFQTFSVSKLFTSLGNRIFEVRFFLPKTGATSPGDVPAVVKGFAAVFTDVDNAGTTALQFF